jgi:hypothetical protein
MATIAVISFVVLDGKSRRFGDLEKRISPVDASMATAARELTGRRIGHIEADSCFLLKKRGLINMRMRKTSRFTNSPYVKADICYVWLKTGHPRKSQIIIRWMVQHGNKSNQFGWLLFY